MQKAKQNLNLVRSFGSPNLGKLFQKGGLVRSLRSPTLGKLDRITLNGTSGGSDPSRHQSCLNSLIAWHNKALIKAYHASRTNAQTKSQSTSKPFILLSHSLLQSPSLLLTFESKPTMEQTIEAIMKTHEDLST